MTPRSLAPLRCFRPTSAGRAHSRRAGVTLVEAMVAIAILAMVSTMVWGSFSQTSKNKKRIEESSERYHAMGMALERLSRELSMAFVSAHLNPSPSLRSVNTAFTGTDSGNTDRIDFTSFSHQRLYRDAHESDQNEISYFVTQHPEKKGVRILARREQARIDDEPNRGGKVEIVVEDVTEFQLDYLDPQTNDWTPTWDTLQGARQPNRLPTQVKIRIVARDPGDPRKSLALGTRATLPMRFGLNHAHYNP